MQTKIWRKVVWNIGLILVIAAIVSVLFWKWFGKELIIRFGYLEVDFFNTVCGILTIIGIIIALYQISELKTEEDIINSTIENTYQEIFKKDSISKFGSLKNDLIKFQERVSTACSYNINEINYYLTTLNRFIIEINEANNRQNSLKSLPIIDCEKSITLLSELMNECDKVNSKNLYGNFKKVYFMTKVTEIISLISDCEQKLKVLNVQFSK